tara:strand:- start:1092 stop:1265 length:174 start_codon:yes stop_codon:yes gene_type:complete
MPSLMEFLIFAREAMACRGSMIEVATALVVRKKSRLDAMSFFILVSLYYEESGAYEL